MINNSENKMDCLPKDCIVLFAKQAGLTSFSSLYTIKHALKTKKVGHTGTLDSFAEGLLVVCCGALTRLAGKITEFDKTYQAVIQFGAETDTLEYTGSLVRTAPLPTRESVERAIDHFTGEIMQVPPAFSAIHVDGKRASDVARSGAAVSIPARKVTVYSSKILDVKYADDNSHALDSALVEFSVSKGTYIRSLARDIGNFASSAAHLTGLFRTKVGDFKVNEAAGFELLEPFTIERVKKNVAKYVALKNSTDTDFKSVKNEAFLHGEVIKKSLPMTRSLAKQCGFSVLNLNCGKENWFFNGGKLSSSLFDVSPFSLKTEFAAVFTSHNTFAGLLQKNESGYFSYSFVCH
ncbi:MAG: tRNA pseudouridine(55) synthase TruB [Treponema sp.]|nr:tRNA pseudouridine(55) synthase TruB [Treponema sp.]